MLINNDSAHADIEPIQINFPDSKVHAANMGLTWDRQGPGGPHVGPVNLAIRVSLYETVAVVW